MAHVIQEEDVFLASFREREKKLAKTEPAWLRGLREEAIGRFMALGFPTTHHEEWKYTNVSALAKIPFQQTGLDSGKNGAQPEPTLKDLESVLWVGSPHLVFV